jgi:hypothetical protein
VDERLGLRHDGLQRLIILVVCEQQLGLV